VGERHGAPRSAPPRAVSVTGSLFALTLTRIYIRAYVKTTRQIGNQTPDAQSNHETLMGLRATPNDGNFETRFGGANGALGYDMVGPGRSDAVSPGQALWGSAPAISANAWHCVELSFIHDNPSCPEAHARVDAGSTRRHPARRLARAALRRGDDLVERHVQRGDPGLARALSAAASTRAYACNVPLRCSAPRPSRSCTRPRTESAEEASGAFHDDDGATSRARAQSRRRPYSARPRTRR
jgi:hypothetical protein